MRKIIHTCRRCSCSFFFHSPLPRILPLLRHNNKKRKTQMEKLPLSTKNNYVKIPSRDSKTQLKNRTRMLSGWKC